MQVVVNDAPAYHRHSLRLSEALAALTRLGLNEDMSEDEVVGALAARGHITNTPSLRGIGAHSKTLRCQNRF
jgi:hypothetical protein